MKLFINLILVFTFLSLSVYADTLRVKPKYLSKHLDKYVILDTRSFGEYEKGHILGALSFPARLTYKNLQNNGRIVNPQSFQKIARNLGISKYSRIVIYENNSFFDAARLFWTLEAYGFKDVKLLDASYTYWINQDYKTSTVIPSVLKSNYIPTIDPQRLATKFSTQIATRTSSKIIIDARSSDGYNGVVSSAKRFGHIPRAINVPATHNIKKLQDGTQKLLDTQEFAKLYANLDREKKVIIYCTVGKVSSTNYFALRELGFDVANYDASWKEWGNELSLPIVSPLEQ